MAKPPRKPTATRKPPVPSGSHAEIDDWIRRVMPDLHPIVEGLDGAIRERVRGLRYAVKWKKAYHGTTELGWVIELVAYDVSVNVVFLGGADFDHPPARRHRSKPLRQGEDAGGGAGTRDARVARASRARGRLEVGPGR